MVSMFAKIAFGAGLTITILSLGFFSGKGPKSGVVAIGIVIAAAVILHVVAP